MVYLLFGNSLNFLSVTVVSLFWKASKHNKYLKYCRFYCLEKLELCFKMLFYCLGKVKRDVLMFGKVFNNLKVHLFSRKILL